MSLDVRGQMLMRKRIREAGKDLRAVFRDMDRDGSGAVSYEELKQLLRCVRVNATDSTAVRLYL